MFCKHNTNRQSTCNLIITISPIYCTSFNDDPSFLIKNRLDWLLSKCLEHKAVKQKASVVPINASTIREAFIWYCRICKNAKK